MSKEQQASKLSTQEKSFITQLWPMLYELYEAIEEGVADAQSFFEGRKAKIDWQLFSHLVRWKVCSRLDGRMEVSEIGFERETLSLSGIEVSFERWLIKVFKADDGDLPAAGKSGRRQHFYDRSFLTSEEDQFNCPNWVVLWDTNWLGNLGDIQLVLPKAGAPPHKSGQQVRAITIPHPAEFPRLRPEDLSDVPTEVELEDEAQDLDVALKAGEDDEL